MRLHQVHDEACYIVHRPNGLPLSFPVGMTYPDAEHIDIRIEPRLPLNTLLNLRQLVTSRLSSLDSETTETEGDHDEEKHVSTTRPIGRKSQNSKGICSDCGQGRSRQCADGMPSIFGQKHQPEDDNT